jgi:hypothetical protein
MPKTKHRFIVTVTGTRTQTRARDAVLFAFACRKPDGCEMRVNTQAEDNRNYVRQMDRAAAAFHYAK